MAAGWGCVILSEGSGPAATTVYFLRPFPPRTFSPLSPRSLAGPLSRGSSLLQTREVQGHAAPSADINSGFCSLTSPILPQDMFLFLSQTAEAGLSNLPARGSAGKARSSSNQCEQVRSAQVPFVPPVWKTTSLMMRHQWK